MGKARDGTLTIATQFDKRHLKIIYAPGTLIYCIYRYIRRLLAVIYTDYMILFSTVYTYILYCIVLLETSCLNIVPF